MVKYQANMDKYRIAFKKNDGKIDAIEASALDQ